MPFIPHTEQEVEAMLKTIGVNSIEDLFDEIPAALRSDTLSHVPERMPEMDISRLMRQRAREDAPQQCYIGAGAYEHHIPAAVWEITTRGEFYTAYTPYQAEASQGTLQLLYEFQSMMTQLTAMQASNASLYDGASALAEAVLMAVRANRKSKSRRVLIPRSVHPHYREVVKNIVHNQGIEILECDFNLQSGRVEAEDLPSDIDDLTALVIPQPNFFGVLENVDELTDWAQAQNALSIACVNPMSLALLKPPGEWGNHQGADIACGEGQPLGIPLSSGGPYFGFMCCKQSLVRQMPGRIIGKTVDADGQTGYALTLQAREQHIRRSKATSNICTNQGLMTTAATIYMSLLGAQGLRAVATQSHRNSIHLLNLLNKLDGVRQAFNSSVFHEAVLLLNKPVDSVLTQMLEQDIQAGLSINSYYPELQNALLICVTETKTDSELERYSIALKQALANS